MIFDYFKVRNFVYMGERDIRMRIFKHTSISSYSLILPCHREIKCWKKFEIETHLLWLHWQRNSWLGTGGESDGKGSAIMNEGLTHTHTHKGSQYSMLSPSFLSWNWNTYREERDKTNKGTEYQFRFPVAPYNATAWLFAYVLCNHDRSISRWLTYETRIPIPSRSSAFNLNINLILAENCNFKTIFSLKLPRIFKFNFISF